MIKLFALILLLSTSYAQTLNSSQAFGLYTTKGEPLELLQLETKVTAEGTYIEIQYGFLYKNPFNSTTQTKFVFPPTENAVFHKFEARIQNRTLTAEIVENPVNQTQNNSQGTTASDSNNFLNIPAQETVHVIFAMIQPLEALFNRFYELKLPAFINGSLPSLQHWYLQIELRSRDPFVVLSNPTHKLIPELSQEYKNSNTIYKAFWNATITLDQDFIVYFGPEDLQKPQFILAAHPEDPEDHVLLLNSIPDGEYFSAQAAQKMLENKTDETMLEMKSLAFNEFMLSDTHCLFIIDRSDSMKGSKIEILKQKLKQLIQYSPYCVEYDVLSFGSSFELYSDTHNIRMIDKEIDAWIDNIEADMGGSDLLKVLQHLSRDGFDNYRDDSDHSYNLEDSEYFDYSDYSDDWHDSSDTIRIILTDGDISYPDQVLKYRKGISAIIAIGNETSSDIIKYLARADGAQINFVLANEGSEGLIFDLMEANSYEIAFSYGYSVKCRDSQNDVIFKKKRSVYAEFDDQDEFFRKWFYLSKITNLEKCDVEIEGAHENMGEISDETQISKTHLIKDTDIWHKVAYDAKIKQLQENFHHLVPQKQKATKKQILNLSLQYQILSPFTSLALQTIANSTEFFDLSNFNKPFSQPPVDISNFVVPKNYIPLDSIEFARVPLMNTTAALNKPKSIDL